MPKKKKATNPKPQKTEKTSPLATGTVLQKKDRNGKVRCACTIEADGYRYEKTLYRSLSSAAAAAAKDLGLVATSINGYVFWGLRKPLGANPVDRFERVWKRYSEIAQQMVNDPALKSRGFEHLRKHLAQMQSVIA